MHRCLATILLLALAPATPAAAQGMIHVPAGEFTMGSTRGDADERPPHKVRLAAFLLDRFEVTVALYGNCVAAGACRKPRPYTWHSKVPARLRGSLPVTGVAWRDADTYCRWAGKRLPTEAQWERAARGTDGRVYPWGGPLKCARANFGNFAEAGLCAGKNPGHPLPVGRRKGGISPTGAHDMAGNVWEWVADDYKPYPGAAGQTGAAPRRKVVRGGSCCSYFVMPRAANRVAYALTLVDADIGFRCAKAAKATKKRSRNQTQRGGKTPHRWPSNWRRGQGAKTQAYWWYVKEERRGDRRQGPATDGSSTRVSQNSSMDRMACMYSSRSAGLVM